jgi:hypothetical protein
MSQALNLAARPFVNRRPVVRLAVLLWLAGALLLAGNLWLYWDFLVGRGDVHARRAETEEAIRVEGRRISALSGELAAFDLVAQNQQVEYLNRRIARRRFSWSRLFDELAEVLPQDVRIQSLAPAVAGEGRRAGPRTSDLPAQAGRVILQMEAHAKSDQAILELVDALFADPDFEHPNLIQQVENEPGLIRFSLEVVYAAPETDGGQVEILPAEGLAEEEAAEGAEDQAGSEDDARPTAPVPLRRPASFPPELS